jgi:hypothetical protein
MSTHLVDVTVLCTAIQQLENLGPEMTSIEKIKLKSLRVNLEFIIAQQVSATEEKGGKTVVLGKL